MKVYVKTIDKKVIEVNNEHVDDSLKPIEVQSIDEFFNEFKDYEVPDDVENEINNYFKNELDIESLSSFNIKHWVSNRSFGELIDMYGNQEIVIPSMQRDFVWDSLKCSRLIESIIMGLPIPPLFLLEIDKSQYELIDGFQRLTTLFNYVNGNPWYGVQTGKRNISSRLSKKVSKELQGKSFEELTDEHQRIIKRSTIPLIEFKQLEPDNLSSKYMIFERINTGSEKLNEMQIRKSLAHGEFINSLYKMSEANEKFLDLFSRGSITKDQHVEAFLRVIAISAIIYKNYQPKKYGINHILNQYCEIERHNSIDDDYLHRFNKAIDKIYDIFGGNTKLFRRVEKNDNGEYVFAGNMNVSIFEALVGVMVFDNITYKDNEGILSNYKIIMNETLTKSLNKIEDNPFTISTGQPFAIKKRFEICKKILS